MMSRTHLAIGLAVSLATIQPTTFHECAVAVIGGAVGGVLADNDNLGRDYQSKVLGGQLVAFAAAFAAFALDCFAGFGIWRSVVDQPIRSMIGGIAFVVLYFAGMSFRHRTFTHSFLAMILYATATAFICMPVSKALAVAYCSHLFLDVLNKKKVYLLYPLNVGICFKICYADKTANKVFLYIGLGVSGILLTAGIITGFSA